MTIVGICPAWRDDNDDWRFAIHAMENSGDRGRIIFGTEEGEQGMSEPKFRTVLAEGFELTPRAVDEALKQAQSNC